MMKNFRILTLLIFTLLTQSTISTGQVEENSYLTFSDEIDRGDTYEWYVEEFSIPEYSTAVPANGEGEKIPLVNPAQNSTKTTATSSPTTSYPTTSETYTSTTTYYSTKTSYQTTTGDYSTTHYEETGSGYANHPGFGDTELQKGDKITIEVLRDPYDTKQDNDFDFNDYFLILINGEEINYQYFFVPLIIPVAMIYQDGRQENYLEYISNSNQDEYADSDFQIVGDEFRYDQLGEDGEYGKIYLDLSSGLLNLYETKDNESWIKIVRGSGPAQADQLADLLPLNFYSFIYGLVFISLVSYRKKKSTNK